MNEEFENALSEMESLILSVRSAMLASVSQSNEPLCSYAPVFVDEQRSFFVYISSLALHTSQIRRSGKASVMLIEDEGSSDNLFARKRLTVSCRAKVLERDSPQWDQIMVRMEERHGSTLASLKGMLDFDLFELQPIDGRLVLGFGRAYKVFGDSLCDIDYIGGGGHRSKKS